MAKRISDISRIQACFETAEPAAIEVALEIIQGIVKRRTRPADAPRKTRADKGTKRQYALPLKEATA